MSQPTPIPFLPENAPFTPEQRAYLNGFFAGLFSRVNPQTPSASSGPTQPLTPLSILFGSQTGNAETLAKRAAKEAAKHGFTPTVHDLANYPMDQLASEHRLLLITSTYGDGEPPDNAKKFWASLSDPAAPRLDAVRFSVCALGDSSYPKFCAFGKSVDARLAALGAQREAERVDCDVDYEEAFARWLQGALQNLLTLRGSTPQSPADRLVQPSPTTVPSRSELQTAPPPPAPATPATPSAVPRASVAPFSRTRPFPAPLVTNLKLNGPGASKDTRHFGLSIEGSGVSYEAGDALGVYPTNDPELVRDILSALGHSGSEPVPGTEGSDMPLEEALLSHYEIRTISQPFLEAVAERSKCRELQRLCQPGINGERTQFLWGRELVDLLLAHPNAAFTPREFVGLLKRLQPRLYSISSSPKAHPSEVHLTTAVVRYETLGRVRRGVCSTFLAERVAPRATVPVFVHANRNFRTPPDPTRPMIMVGPGTGIAPFRAFLEERRATQATGRNWLFFGDQHLATDFLYRDELQALMQEGVLTRLDTAFSRDQSEKVYVQHRMLDHSRELFSWLEEGAHFYVCGDARRMAKDVDAALHEVVARGGQRTAAQAADYVETLKSQRRYQRDVY